MNEGSEEGEKNTNPSGDSQVDKTTNEGDSSGYGALNYSGGNKPSLGNWAGKLNIDKINNLLERGDGGDGGLDLEPSQIADLVEAEASAIEKLVNSSMVKGIARGIGRVASVASVVCFVGGEGELYGSIIGGIVGGAALGSVTGPIGGVIGAAGGAVIGGEIGKIFDDPHRGQLNPLEK